MLVMIDDILNKQNANAVVKREMETRKRFEERYKNILTEAPSSDEIRIQYFTGIMLNFLPTIFHGEWNSQFNAYVDFSEFYLNEFDSAYSEYLKENQSLQKEYPFRFSPLETNALERELHDCLLQLCSLRPKKSSREKAEGIIWQTCRLFELYHNLNDWFLEKILREEREGETSLLTFPPLIQP